MLGAYALNINSESHSAIREKVHMYTNRICMFYMLHRQTKLADRFNKGVPVSDASEKIQEASFGAWEGKGKQEMERLGQNVFETGVSIFGGVWVRARSQDNICIRRPGL